MVDGIIFNGVPVSISKIILAFIVFASANICGRFIAGIAIRKNQYQGEIDTQVAIATMLSYLSFAIAILLALFTAGINLTGITVIAGALSLGIGLGLQDIVNNFVSGLILLIEKPISVGDRIIIGKTEGLVKNIRIRSTQLRT